MGDGVQTSFTLVLQMRYALQHFPTLQCEVSNDIPRLYSEVTSDIFPHRLGKLQMYANMQNDLWAAKLGHQGPICRSYG